MFPVSACSWGYVPKDGSYFPSTEKVKMSWEHEKEIRTLRSRLELCESRLARCHTRLELLSHLCDKLESRNQVLESRNQVLERELEGRDGGT